MSYILQQNGKPDDPDDGRYLLLRTVIRKTMDYVQINISVAIYI